MPTGAYRWKDLTSPRQTPGRARKARGLSVKVAGRVHVKVLTTTGAVFETSCALTLTCTLGWAAVVGPGDGEAAALSVGCGTLEG